jgi:membrane protease YdiL (CAAX protease family)
MTKINIRDRRRSLEIAGVLITGLGKFVFMDYLNLKLLYIVLSVIGWGIYLIMRAKADHSIMRYWGFRSDNLKKVLAIVLPWAISAVLACILVGLWQRTINPTWHIVPLLIIYPIWGVVQQFLVVALIAGNLQDLNNRSISKPAIIALTAVVFGLVHFPYLWLMVGTFLLALFYSYIYLRERNLWVLGVVHGWLGTLFFYTVVERDPFMEIFGNYLN